MADCARALCLAILAGCSPATSVLVTIQAAPGVQLGSGLAVDATVDGATHSAEIPPPVALPGTLLVALPDEATLVAVAARATDPAGKMLLGQGSIESAAGAQVELTLTLGGALLPDLGVDLRADASGPRDLAGADLTIDLCENGQHDPNEQGIDCGTACAMLCPGAGCTKDAECVTGVCDGVCVPASAPPSWLPGPSLGTPRALLALAATPDGTLYAIAGTTDSTATGETTIVERLVPGSGAWSTIAPLAAVRYELAAAVDDAGLLYAIGGRDAKGGIASVESFQNGGWVSAPAMPGSHSAIAAVTLLDGRILVIDSGNCTVYDPGTAKWADQLPLRDSITAVRLSDGRAFALGGRSGGLGLTNVDAWSPTTGLWTARAPLSVQRIYAGSAIAPDGRIYAVGGTTGSAVQATVEAYLPGVDQWTRRVALLGTPRYGLGAALGPDGRIWAAGGTSDTGAVLGSVEAYGTLLQLSAPHAAAGAMVTVSGTNFAAGAAVGVSFDGAPVASATTDGAGAFQVAFAVPAAAAGAHQIVAVDARAQYPAARPFAVP